MIEDYSEVEVKAPNVGYITATHSVCEGTILSWSGGGTYYLNDLIDAVDEHECGRD